VIAAAAGKRSGSCQPLACDGDVQLINVRTLAPSLLPMCAPLPLHLVLTVPARRLAGAGPIVCMSVLSMPPHHYLLVVHEGSGAAVWDLRAQIIVAVARHSSSGGGGGCNSGDDGHTASASSTSSKLAAITAAAWLPGSSKGDFATGHVDGAVCIWEMPASAGNSATSSSATSNGPVKQQQTLQAKLVSQLQGGSSASGGGSPKKHRHSSSRAGPRLRPVASLEFAAGAVECLVVFGGNEEDRPDGLTLRPLPEPSPVRLTASCTRLSAYARRTATGSCACSHWPLWSQRAVLTLLVWCAVLCCAAPTGTRHRGCRRCTAASAGSRSAAAVAGAHPADSTGANAGAPPWHVGCSAGAAETSVLEGEGICLFVCWVQGCSMSSSASRQ
jgi:hypothetical protein